MGSTNVFFLLRPSTSLLTYACRVPPSTRHNDPTTVANTHLTALDTLVTQINSVAIPALAADMSTVTTQYATVKPALDWLLVQLVVINTTVLELTPDMQAAYDSASAAATSLVGFFNSTPSPTALATDLASTSASSFAMPATTTALSTNLAAQAAVLNGAQFDATPVGSDGDLIKTWVAASKAAITSATAAFNTMVSARDTYFATPSNANYDAMKTAADNYRTAPATAALVAKLGEQDSAPSAAANFVAPSTSVRLAGAAAYTGLNAYVGTAQAAITTAPALGTYASSLAAVTLPASTTFDAPQAALDAIEAAVITQGDQVKAQVASTLASFSGATGSLQTSVIDRMDSVQVGGIRLGELGWVGLRRLLITRRKL